MVEDFDIAGELKPVIEKLQSLLDQLGDKGWCGVGSDLYGADGGTGVLLLPK